LEAASDPSIQSLGGRGRRRPRLRARPHRRGWGGQLFAAKPKTSAIETHPLGRPQGRSQTRPRADDLRDEAPNHFADDAANYLADELSPNG